MRGMRDFAVAVLFYLAVIILALVWGVKHWDMLDD